MAESNITIRKAESIADYLACQRAQKLAWGITDDSYLVPLATMVGAQLHGGLVLGAFTPSGEAVGLSFAFVGKLGGHYCLYSQLTGIVPGYQGLGLGGKLKQTQRDHAREQGLHSIAWAFDPLQSGNAHFNLERLGATVATFVENMYGRRTDALNANAGTDRLIAEWETNPTAREPITTLFASFVQLVVLVDGLPECQAPASWKVDELAIAIPDEISRIRQEDPSLAERWSLAVREAFQLAFAHGFVGEGFARTEDGQQGYLLRKRTRPSVQPAG